MQRLIQTVFVAQRRNLLVGGILARHVGDRVGRDDMTDREGDDHQAQHRRNEPDQPVDDENDSAHCGP